MSNKHFTPQVIKLQDFFTIFNIFCFFFCEEVSLKICLQILNITLRRRFFMSKNFIEKKYYKIL